MNYVLKIISELGAISTLTFIEAAMEFSTTQKGKTLLKHAGYEYLHKRSNMDGSEVWRCIVHKQARCPAILKNSGNQIIREPNRHTHQTDLARSKARRVVRSLKNSVETCGRRHPPGCLQGHRRGPRGSAGSDATEVIAYEDRAEGAQQQLRGRAQLM